MTLAQLRAHCLSLPGSREQMQWVSHLVFKVGGKMYLVASPDDPLQPLTIKCPPEEFDDAVEMPGIRPAPYMARAKWVQLETMDTLPSTELKRWVTRSYELVRAKLKKKAQAQLQASSPAKARARSKASLP